MRNNIAYFIFLILPIILFSFNLEGQNQSLTNNEKEKSLKNCQKSTINYKVWKTGKSEDDDGVIYISFVSFEEESLSPKNICEVAKTLNKHFEKKARVKIFLFDNDKVAKSASEGKFHPQDLSLLMRAMYFLDRNNSQEYITFYSEIEKSRSEVKVQIRDKCNKKIN